MEAFSVRFLMIGVYFLLFSFILLRSIVVYLKSGSRMTFFVFSFIFFKSIVVYLKLGSRLTFLLTFLCAFLLTFSLAFLLTFNLHLLTRRREEEEGVDLFLKSNDPTPEGGEKKKKTKKRKNKKNKKKTKKTKKTYLFFRRPRS